MIGAYLIGALVIGIVLAYLGIIHHFWLKQLFKEEALEEAAEASEQEMAHTKTIASGVERSQPYESDTATAQSPPEHLTGQTAVKLS